MFRVAPPALTVGSPTEQAPRLVRRAGEGLVAGRIRESSLNSLVVGENKWAELVHLGLGAGSQRSSSSGDIWACVGLPSCLTTYLTLLQRFRFCGDLDCPDWVLAEISTLAKIVECRGSWGWGHGGIAAGGSCGGRGGW